MSVTISVLYPNTAGARFDKDYYINKHIPLVKEKWQPHGLVNISLLTGLMTPNPKIPAPHQLIALLEFESLDAFKEAGKAAGADVMGDLANFTDVDVVVQINDRSEI